MIVWINLVDNSAPGMSGLSDVRNVRFGWRGPIPANYEITKKYQRFRELR